MMEDTYGDPPPIREVFDSREEEIDYLVDQATYWFWRDESDLPKARYYADRLATLIDEPSLENPAHSEEWALVCEARGDFEEAIRFADMTINGYKAYLAYFDDSDHHKDWFREDLGALRDALFLQADRYIRLGDRENAKQRLIESAELSKQYGMTMDDDLLALLQELAPDYRWIAERWPDS